MSRDFRDFKKYPYQDYTAYNLDGLLDEMKSLEDKFEVFAHGNKLNYADPFTWDITSTYNPNTMVLSPDGTTVFISLQRVPPGVQLNDRNYWMAVFDASSYNLLQDQINGMGLIVGNHTEELSALNALMPQMKYPAKAFSASYAVCFGDSNTIASPPSDYGNTFNRICDYLHPKNKKTYGQNNAVFQNDISGKPVIMDQISGANDFPASEVGFVFLMGGINDYHYGNTDATAFGTAVGNTVNAIHAKFPNALIVAAMDSGSRLPNGMMLLYQASFSRGATNNTSGAPVIVVSLADIPLMETLFVNVNHYNSLGASAIASRVINKVFGGGTGYQIRPRREAKHYIASDPGPNGAYNYYAATLTTIDPDKLERHDWHRIYTETTFKPGASSSAAEFCTLPGTYQPAYYFTDNGGYMPFSLLYSTASTIETVLLENVDRQVLTKEPKITVKNIYNKDFSGKRGYLEFTSHITMWDTGI